jgi:allantoinase
MASKRFHWPNGKRIAIVATAQLEVWSEGKAPNYSVQTTSLSKGHVDHGGIAWARYGANVGVWRVLRAFNHFKLRGTFAANSMCTEIIPDAMAEIVKSGHDICAHAVWQDQGLADMSVEDQKRTIRKCLDMFETATRQRPRGWKSPADAFTPDTVGFLVEEDILWHGDRKDIDLPEIQRVGNKSIVAIPPTDFNDNRTLKSSARHYFEVTKDTFDYLYRHEPASLLNVTVHCQWGGRPPIMAMFYELYDYFSKFPDVWYASQVEIAEWMNSQQFTDTSYRARYFEK